MARYGAGYSADLASALNNIELSVMTALKEAWEIALVDLQDKIEEVWEDWVDEIYSETDHNTYERTYQLKAEPCPVRIIDKTSGIAQGNSSVGTVVATFEYDKVSMSPDNPPYHILEDKGTLELIQVLENDHDVLEFVDELKLKIFGTNVWADIYRNACKKMGLKL